MIPNGSHLLNVSQWRMLEKLERSNPEPAVVGWGNVGPVIRFYRQADLFEVTRAGALKLLA